MPSFPLDKKSRVSFEAIDWGRLSDTEIFFYSKLVAAALESKADFYRMVRKGSTTIGALAAGFGTGIHGAFKADADTLTMVAGVATVMPLLQHIWKVGEASEAQEDGVRMINDAMGRFMESVGYNGKINEGKVTIHGAKLYKEVNSALNVVRAAIAKNIPRLEDLKTALGKEEKVLKFKVQPDPLVISAGDSAVLNVFNGYAINAIPSDTSVVTVAPGLSVDKPQNEIKVAAPAGAISSTSATITIIDSNGETAVVIVNIP